MIIFCDETWRSITAAHEKPPVSSLLMVVVSQLVTKSISRAYRCNPLSDHWWDYKNRVFFKTFQKQIVFNWCWKFSKLRDRYGREFERVEQIDCSSWLRRTVLMSSIWSTWIRWWRDICEVAPTSPTERCSEHRLSGTCRVKRWYA